MVCISIVLHVSGEAYDITIDLSGFHHQPANCLCSPYWLGLAQKRTIQCTTIMFPIRELADIPLCRLHLSLFLLSELHNGQVICKPPDLAATILGALFPEVSEVCFIGHMGCKLTASARGCIGVAWLLLVGRHVCQTALHESWPTYFASILTIQSEFVGTRPWIDKAGWS